MYAAERTKHVNQLLVFLSPRQAHTLSYAYYRGHGPSTSEIQSSNAVIGRPSAPGGFLVADRNGRRTGKRQPSRVKVPLKKRKSSCGTYYVGTYTVVILEAFDRAPKEDHQFVPRVKTTQTWPKSHGVSDRKDVLPHQKGRQPMEAEVEQS